MFPCWLMYTHSTACHFATASLTTTFVLLILSSTPMARCDWSFFLLDLHKPELLLDLVHSRWEEELTQVVLCYPPYRAIHNIHHVSGTTISQLPSLCLLKDPTHYCHLQLPLWALPSEFTNPSNAIFIFSSGTVLHNKSYFAANDFIFSSLCVFIFSISFS